MVPTVRSIGVVGIEVSLLVSLTSQFEVMNKEKLQEIINYIAQQGLKTIKENTSNEQQAALDYLAIFSKDEDECKGIDRVLEPIGEDVDKEVSKTGRTFKLFEPLTTPVGPIYLLKVRRPDPTRPQRGAPDFRVPSYDQFKEKYLKDGGNMTLMIRSAYEMIEIKGVDVLVYIPSHPLSERLEVVGS